jgi:hypothetical protein
MDAVTALMRRLKLPITAFSCAGTKDKVCTCISCVLFGIQLHTVSAVLA